MSTNVQNTIAALVDQLTDDQGEIVEPHQVLLSEFTYQAQHVATALGRYNAATCIRLALEHEHGGPAEAAKEAARILSRGPEDTSSGRGNDLYRAYSDGQRAVAGRAIEDYLYNGVINMRRLERI
jgi:hypothetical protein